MRRPSTRRTRTIRQHTSAYVSIRQHTRRTRTLTLHSAPQERRRSAAGVSICTFVLVKQVNRVRMCQYLYFVLVKQTQTEYRADSGQSRSSLGATAQSAPQTRACQLLRCQKLYLCTSEASKRRVVTICEHTERQAPAALSASVFVLLCW